MTQNNLQSSDFFRQDNLLEALFWGKNKAYGAYELRRKYAKRLLISLILVCSVLALVFASVLLYEWIAGSLTQNKKVEVKTVTLENIKPPEPEKIIPPPPPPKPKEIKIKTVKLTPPRVVDDEEVIEPPPSIDEFKDARIGTFSQEGISDDGSVVAPADDDGVGEGPKVSEEPALEKVDQIAEFPGGAKAWLRYVEREIQKYIDELTDAQFSGTVEVQFIVDRNGKVSDVKALTNPGTKLAEIAVKAIQNGPNWIPAVNNGKTVKSYRKQPVTFRLEEE